MNFRGRYPNPSFPFDPREADFLQNGGNTPPLTPEDAGLLWSEGVVPPAFYNDEIAALGLGALGHPRDASRRILEEDARLAASLPETAEHKVKARGGPGYSFQELQDNNLGNAAALKAGQENQIVVQARGLDHLTPVAIALGYDVISPELSTDDIFLQAKIKWGVGGAQHDVWVDVGRGTQIRLQSASFLEVSYSYLPDQTTSPPRTGPNIMAKVLFGYGLPSFRSSPARYTQRVGTITASGGTSSVIPIPKFAASYGIVGEKGSIASSTVTLLPSLTNDGNGHQVVQQITDGQPESQYFIPNAFRAMQITNGSSTTQAFEVVFTLML
jgi:hypothetical protein